MVASSHASWWQGKTSGGATGVARRPISDPLSAGLVVVDGSSEMSRAKLSDYLLLK